MLQVASKRWWLLALCGVFYAITSVIYFSHAEHGFMSQRSVVFVGKLALAAGACTIAAGIWRSAKDTSWLLVLNGLSLGVLGLVFNGVFGFRISFRTVALLIIMMAGSIGILELLSARNLRRQHYLTDGWALGFAGVASLGFALIFLVLGFGLVKIQPGSHPDLLWLGSYFAFGAICMLALVLRLYRPLRT